MLKLTPSYIKRLLNKRCVDRIRNDAYWTDVYPSSEPSWLSKRVVTAGDWIFNSIDIFFQGSVSRNIETAEGNLSFSDQLSSTYAEWELNQDIVDIALIDIRSSFSLIMPGFLKKIAFRLQQLTFLYLFTDLPNENQFQEWIEIKDKNIIQHEPDKCRAFHPLQVIKDKIGPKCLSINDWLKNIYNRLRIVRQFEQNKKTYYLLGYFAPFRYDDQPNDLKHMIRGPDKVKLYPAYSFHKRI